MLTEEGTLQSVQKYLQTVTVVQAGDVDTATHALTNAAPVN